MKIEVKHKAEFIQSGNGYIRTCFLIIDGHKHMKWEEECDLTPTEEDFLPPDKVDVPKHPDQAATYLAGLMVGKLEMGVPEALGLANNIFSRASRMGGDVRTIKMNAPLSWKRDVVEVEPREGRNIWVKFEDGVSGYIDLSDCNGPIFNKWEDRKFFESVHVDKEIGSVGWGDDPTASDYIDLCPDTLYMDVTLMTPEELFADYYSRKEE